jgi:lambda family phage portal protein
MDAITKPEPKSLRAMDRFLLAIAPGWALGRMRARAAAITLARHYEAAQPGRRTSGWHRSGADANAANGPALAALRWHSRDLVRNNGWARQALQVIARNSVGWGIVPKPVGAGAEAVERARELWKRWAADTTECDADGRLTFYGLQRLAIETIAESGEVLIRRRRRRAEDGLAIPLQLQVLEPDFLDTAKDAISGPSGGPIIQGVEFDAIGRRVAYWLFEEHPGSNRNASFVSRRIPAADILHVFRVERPGQVRGVSWFAPAIVKLKDFDEYEDAVLMRQKIAACFAAFVTETDGVDNPIGAKDPENPLVETLEPGLVSYLPPGKNITFAAPPPAGDNESFSATTLRRIAASMGVTYEDLTGDYSKVNFSSARMARLAHWANVHDWRWNMLVPQLCNGVWGWAMEAASIAGLIRETPRAEWTPPPMPMLEPDKEGLAYARLVRTGSMTHDEMVREQGGDPETHWAEYAEGLKRLDQLGIVLDSDARKTTSAGLLQKSTGAGAGDAKAGEGESPES